MAAIIAQFALNNMDYDEKEDRDRLVNCDSVLMLK